MPSSSNDIYSYYFDENVDDSDRFMDFPYGQEHNKITFENFRRRVAASSGDKIIHSFQRAERIYLQGLRKASLAILGEEERGSYFQLDCNASALGISKKITRRFPADEKCDLLTGDYEFDTFTAITKAYFTKDLDVVRSQLMLRYLYGRLFWLKNYVKTSDILMKDGKNIVFKYLNHISPMLSKEFTKLDGQFIPIQELVGGSGVGKSTSVLNIKFLIHALVPLIPLSEIVYTRANDYWWNGYKGQLIVLYDDFTHIKKKLKFDLIAELIMIGSGTFKNPPMAFIKDMPFVSCGAYATSNIPLLTTVGVRETATALKRRLTSSQWVPLKGIFDNTSKSYKFKGNLLNAIHGYEQNIFNTFNIVIDAIINHSIIAIECDSDVDIDLGLTRDELALAYLPPTLPARRDGEDEHELVDPSVSLPLSLDNNLDVERNCSRSNVLAPDRPLRTNGWFGFTPLTYCVTIANNIF